MPNVPIYDRQGRGRAELLQHVFTRVKVKMYLIKSLHKY